LLEWPVLSSYRLPLSFDAEQLQADLERIRPAEWVAHFNTRDYDGDWHGVALRAVAGDAACIFANPNAQGKYGATAVLARCPYLQMVLSQFQCPLNSVRLLRLGAGAVIREHRDHQLGFAEGEVRLHIPVTTNPDVAFVVNGRRLVMNAGECWYIDFSLPHRVANRGSTDRVHLILDCTVNNWLRALLPAEIHAQADEPAPLPAAGEEPPSPEALQRFRQMVLDDLALQEELRDTMDRELFVATVVRLGAERGCHIAPGDVEEAMRAGRRVWLERWIA
jgi:mannose-6-phosphate isomerase-like protein (cupin superfamily)